MSDILEAYKKSGYPIPQNEEEENKKQFDYLDMIGFAESYIDEIESHNTNDLAARFLGKYGSEYIDLEPDLKTKAQLPGVLYWYAQYILNKFNIGHDK